MRLLNLVLKLNKEIKTFESFDATSKNIEIKGIAYHSGKVKPHFLFVAMKGTQADGHDYVQQAIQAGAVAIVTEHKLNVDIPQVVVSNSRKALALISCEYYEHPSSELVMIGVTATNGKTSTAFMIESILQSYGIKTGMVGTVLIDTGARRIPSALTTPESLDLQEHLREMVTSGVNVCIMEVSSSALEHHRVTGIVFDIACFNNISREHIDLHHSYEEYIAYKSSLITDLPSDSVAVLSEDDSLILSLVEQTAGRVVTFSVKNELADFSAQDIDITSGRATFDLCYRPTQQKIRVSLHVSGFHSVMNALSAASVAMIAGADFKSIREGLESFQGVERRFEMIYDGEFKVVDDHFANVGNINVTMETLKRMDYRKLYVVYAIRGNRGVTVNRENAEAIVSWRGIVPMARLVVTTAADFTSTKDRVQADEVEGFDLVCRAADCEYQMMPSLIDAVQTVMDDVEPGDLILLAGCQGMDSGARVLLTLLSKQKNDPTILERIQGRVCG